MTCGPRRLASWGRCTPVKLPHASCLTHAPVHPALLAAGAAHQRLRAPPTGQHHPRSMTTRRSWGRPAQAPPRRLCCCWPLHRLRCWRRMLKGWRLRTRAAFGCGPANKLQSSAHAACRSRAQGSCGRGAEPSADRPYGHPLGIGRHAGTSCAPRCTPPACAPDDRQAARSCRTTQGVHACTLAEPRVRRHHECRLICSAQDAAWPQAARRRYAWSAHVVCDGLRRAVGAPCSQCCAKHGRRTACASCGPLWWCPLGQKRLWTVLCSALNSMMHAAPMQAC